MATTTTTKKSIRFNLKAEWESTTLYQILFQSRSFTALGAVLSQVTLKEKKQKKKKQSKLHFVREFQ